MRLQGFEKQFFFQLGMAGQVVLLYQNKAEMLEMAQALFTRLTMSSQYPQ